MGGGAQRTGGALCYLVGSRAVRARGPPQLLLEPVVRAMTQAVDGPRGQEDAHDGRHGEEGEHRELGGVLGVPLLRPGLQLAPLQERRRW